MNQQQRPRTFVRHALSAAVALALAGVAQAQISTATVRGQAGAPANTAIVAVNKDTGATYRGSVRSDGSYVLTGLAPGEYTLRVGSGAALDITLSVGETATVDLGAAAPAPAPAGAAQQIVVTGSALRKDVRNSEVGTTVSRRLIETLPQNTRNFLSSADLSPGVSFGVDNSGNSTIQGGAQDFNHVNVFIDGVGQKNNILKGGLTGQDSSRGNPFPQSAIAEYRVLTQNYKAEYDQVSSVAITAITKSGTNTFTGDAYIDRTGTNWRQKTEFEELSEAQGVARPASEKKEYGFSIGGPIARDKLHFFFAYDGKNIDDSRQITEPPNLVVTPPNAGIVPGLRSQFGGYVLRFKEHLAFGKLDAQIGDAHRLSASFRIRREDDQTAESTSRSAPDNLVLRSNDETRVDAKWEWAGDAWLSELRLGYEEYVWNPRADSNTPFFKYSFSGNTPQQRLGAQEYLYTGGSPNAQKRGQEGLSLSEDFTYTGLAGHTLKGGVKIKAMKYDLSGTAFAVDTVEVVIDRVSGLPYYAGGLCTGTNVINNGLQSDQCLIRPAIPGAGSGVDYKNTQIGLYFQDDWAITKQLELNLGIRYDYETNMLNEGYATPADRVAAIRAIDVPRYNITPPAGQTYEQSLARGGININDYISTGSSRKDFKGAFAPRIGFSYDVFADRNSVVFGGVGRSYSRTVANNALDELQKNSQPGGEIWLVKNDYDMPYADQFSLGLRQGLGTWNAELSVSRIHSKKQWVWFLGNRDANGGFATQSPVDPLWGGPNGFGSLILGDSVGETKTDSVFFKLEKPYTRSSGWSANLAYTYSDAKTTNREWTNDIFDFTYGRGVARGFNPSTLVAKHAIVAAAQADLPWGITLAGKLKYDTGLPRRIVSCAAGFSECIAVRGETPDFKQVDLSASKSFTFFGQSIGLRGDVLNVFDSTNYGGFDDWGGGPVPAGGTANPFGGDNLNVLKPNAARGDTRTYRLALTYRF